MRPNVAKNMFLHKKNKKMTVIPSPIINAELQNFLLQKLSQIIVDTSFFTGLADI